MARCSIIRGCSDSSYAATGVNRSIAEYSPRLAQAGRNDSMTNPGMGVPPGCTPF